MTKGKNSLGQQSTNILPQLTPINSSNQFNRLNPDDDMSDNDSLQSQASKRRKISKSSHHPANTQPQNSVHKPPPITVHYKTFSHVSDAMKKFNNEDYSIKLTSQGIKIFTTTTAVFKSVKNHLQSASMEIHTHALREEQLSKFVLHGYYNSPDETLMWHLKQAKLNPIKVKQMTIKQKKYRDQYLYLVYFKKTDNIKISMLREVKAIDHIRVNWDYYSNKRTGPIQCSNCQNYGHGGSNCHKKPKCIRCSGDHESIKCPLLVGPNMQVLNKIPDQKLKCANCGQNHTANYTKCEKRIEFIERQKLHRSRVQRKNQQYQNNFRPAPELNNFHFPQINPQSTPWTRNENPNLQQNTSSNLFNGNELLEIFTDMMSKMQGAQSKMHQIQILGEIVIKYTTR
jgi:hypothetical protein